MSQSLDLFFNSLFLALNYVDGAHSSRQLFFLICPLNKRHVLFSTVFRSHPSIFIIIPASAFHSIRQAPFPYLLPSFHLLLLRDVKPRLDGEVSRKTWFFFKSSTKANLPIV